MSINAVTKKWLESSQDTWQTALLLSKSKQCHHALFFVHLTLEKILKGLHLAKFQQPAPYTHDLAKLAHKLDLKLTSEEMAQLGEIATFNISARYEDYKYTLYKKATKEFTNLWLENGKVLREKLLQEMKKYE